MNVVFTFLEYLRNVLVMLSQCSKNLKKWFCFTMLLEYRSHNFFQLDKLARQFTIIVRLGNQILNIS